MGVAYHWYIYPVKWDGRGGGETLTTELNEDE